MVKFPLAAAATAAALLLLVMRRRKCNVTTATNKHAKVYLVGAGPGAMDLITVRALRILQHADVVLSDRLVDPDQLVQACRPGCLIVNVGKDASKERFTQQDLESELVMHAKQAGDGAIVVRFKGGDPFVFGLGGSEIEALEANGIEWEYVPGLSSAMTLPGMALNAPLTHKGVSNGFIVLSGHKVIDSKEWDELPVTHEPSTTLVVLMCAKNLERISTFLLETKQWSSDLPCAVVQNGTTAGERTVRATLSTIASQCKSQNCFQAPLTLVVGKVVDLFYKEQQQPEKQQQQQVEVAQWSAFREPTKPQQDDDEDEWWVFGYGSLVWRPDLPFIASHDGHISGYVRRFYQTSPDHRGTEQSPGRVVTLVAASGEDPNHRVFGKVYLVDRKYQEETQAKLRHREKAGYEERQVIVTVQHGKQIKASVFWAPESNEHFSLASVEDIASQIATSHGPSGPNLEYFDRLFQAMHEIKLRWWQDDEHIVDEHLLEIKRHLTL